MDHYNAIVHNGALVSTRRGLHVSKTKHQGTRFVNTFAAPAIKARASSGNSSSGGSSGPEAALPNFAATGPRKDGQPFERKFKFVAKPREKAPGAPRSRPRSKPHKPPTPPSTSGSDYGDDAAIVAAAGAGSGASDSSASASPPSSSGVVARRWKSYNSSPEDDSQADAAETFFRQSPVSAYMPKAWKTHLYGHDMPDFAHYTVHTYLWNVPRYLYPYEELLTYNPVRDPSFFQRINIDSITMAQCVMTSSAIEAIISGDLSFKELTHHTNKLCSMLNKRLLSNNISNWPAIMEAISSLAILGILTGRYDHWHVHMKGLRYIVARNGGIRPEWGHVLNKVRKADIKGAAYSGSIPYLEYRRFCSPISDILTPEVRADLALNTQHLLQVCGIEQINIESMRTLVFFAQTLKLARHAPSGSILFDPHAYSEDYFWVEHQLVRYPGPLRDQAPIDQVLIDQLQTAESEGPPPPTDWPVVDETGPNVYFSAEAEKAVAALTVNLLDPLVRIAAILYIEELLPELRSVDSYGVLLSMLSNQMRTIVTRLHEREVLHADMGFAFDGMPHTGAMRPLLIWVCMVAYSLGCVVDNESAYRLPHMDHTPYQDCMALVVGPTCSDVDTLQASDFELCRLLAVQEMRAVIVDDRTFLKQIVGDYEKRSQVRFM